MHTVGINHEQMRPKQLACYSTKPYINQGSFLLVESFILVMIASSMVQLCSGQYIGITFYLPYIIQWEITFYVLFFLEKILVAKGKLVISCNVNFINARCACRVIAYYKLIIFKRTCLLSFSVYMSS